MLAVGTELTHGKIQDSHLQFIGRHLVRLGLALRSSVHLPDDRALFLSELRRVAAEAEVVFVTGGLGPTSDDLTREVIAEAAGVELVYYPAIWQALEQRFTGRRLPEANRRQCYAPAGFTVIENRHGTAPGFHGRVGGALVVAMPGPPRELEPMFADDVIPLLAAGFSVAPEEETAGTAHLIGESALEDALIRCAVPGVSWGTRIADDRVAFYLRGGTAGAREAFLAALERSVGPVHIRRGDRGAGEVLLDALRGSGARLAVAESCTGGLVSKWITDIPGSSAAFLGGVVAYANSLKCGVLGVDAATLERHGAVSAEVVEAMADGVLRLADADYGLAVSGIAGPDGGTAEKPVGTVWIAARSRAGGGRTERFFFPGSREAMRRRSASAACILAECLVAGREWRLYAG
jgi:nicotinamide-nucleotide amidase